MNVFLVHVQIGSGLICGIDRKEVLGLVDLNLLLLEDSDLLGIRLSSAFVKLRHLDLMTTRLNQLIDFLSLKGIHLQLYFEQLDIGQSLFLIRSQIEVWWKATFFSRLDLKIVLSILISGMT